MGNNLEEKNAWVLRSTYSMNSTNPTTGKLKEINWSADNENNKKNHAQNYNLKQ